MPAKNVIKKSALAPTVLIAGGAGFIGSHLAEALLSKEARVVVLDNFKTGDRAYLNHLLENPNFALFEVDINFNVPSSIETVDYIFHLAGHEEYLYSKDQVDLDALLTNAFGTKNLLDLAARSHAKFLFVSSTDVYEGMMSQVNLEQYFGKSGYEEKKFSHTEAKRFAEALIWEFYRKHEANVRIVRLPEVFGPKMNFEASGALGSLMKNLLDRKNLVILGEGTQKEYYTYISDAVSGIVKALFTNNTEGKIYNLVGKEPYSPLEIAFLLKSLAETTVDVEFKSKTKASTLQPRIPDTANLAEINWEAKVAFKDSIAKTLKYFGYEVNEHSFKPNKLIEKKAAEELSAANNAVSTLTDIKLPEPVPKAANPKNLTSTIVQEPIYKIIDKSETTTVPNAFVRHFAGFNAKSAAVLFVSLFISFNLIFVALPLFQVYNYSKTALKEMEKIPVYLASLDVQASQSSADKAFQNFVKAQDSLQKVRWLFKLVGKKEQFNSSARLLSSTTYFAKSAYNLSKASMPFSAVWEIIRPTTDKTFNQEDYEASFLSLNTAKSNLQLSEAEFKHVDAEKLPASTRKTVYEYGSYFGKVSQGLNFTSDVMSELPALLGVDKPRKYLILFQNPTEIRPTGGFIGSYALLELSKGKITNLTIDDVYNPDGQLELRNVKTDVPETLKKFLNEETLTIRNANWDPNFPSSAQTISDLYFKATGNKVDGVIALDLFFVENLLKVTGPVFLTAYNEEISAENLYERTQFHSEFNYENGSDQKKSFLTILGSKLLEKVFSLPKDKIALFLNEIFGALNQKHMLIYLANSPVSVLLNTKEWDGSLVSTTGDYLYVVNANLGGTKANYFVENKMDYQITSKTRDGNLRAELVLTYKHNGQDTSWPGGPYTNYLRVLTQNGSTLTGAKLKTGSGEAKDIFEKITIAKAGAYNSFETSFILQPRETVQLMFYYDLPQNLWITQNNKNYSLMWQKQPGTQKDAYGFTFTPFFGTVVQAASNLKTIDNVLRDSGTLDENKTFSVSLQ